MTRPEYVNGNDGLPSNETWEQACIISQEWADDARSAAAKRHMRRFWMITTLQWFILLIAVLLILLLTNTINP